MKSFSKYLICFIVVALTLCIGVPQVKADSLLFPFFASGNGAFTFFSVQTWSAFNGFKGGVPANGPNPIVAHATYYYIPYVPASTYTLDGSACVHQDVLGSTTPQDLMQWEATKQVDSSLAPISQTDSVPPYLTGAGAASVGFMIYDDDTLNVIPSIKTTLPGQAIIIDTNTGLVAGYKALENFLAPPGASTNWSFPVATIATTLHPTAKLTWMMSNYESTDVETEWFMVVTGNAMGNPWRGMLSLTNGFGFVWNQNEVPLSDNKRMPATCFRTFTRSDIMNAGGVSHTNPGGMWWEVAGVPCWSDGTNGVGGGAIPPIGGPGVCGLNAPGTGPNPGRGAVMLKLEATKVLGPGLGGNDVWSLTFENAWPNLPY